MANQSSHFRSAKQFLEALTDFPQAPFSKLRPSRAEQSGGISSLLAAMLAFGTHLQKCTLRSCLLYPAASRCVGLYPLASRVWSRIASMVVHACHARSTVVLAAAAAFPASCVSCSRPSPILHLCQLVPVQGLPQTEAQLVLRGIFQLCGRSIVVFLAHQQVEFVIIVFWHFSFWRRLLHLSNFVVIILTTAPT